MRLGPFKMEHLNKNGNYIALVHSLLSKAEMEDVKNQTRGNMKATPYQTNLKTEDFSYKRTSKIKYFRFATQYVGSYSFKMIFSQ